MYSLKNRNCKKSNFFISTKTKTSKKFLMFTKKTPIFQIFFHLPTFLKIALYIYAEYIFILCVVAGQNISVTLYF